ncbi:MAG: hypothetical protein LH613_03265 [Chamaesiphon sp.]|nr:hypothetical protein [Chamaesiphon sp.]
MKYSHLIAIILTLAPIGLLPARADQAVIDESVQNAIVNGNGNTVNQSNTTNVQNRGNRSGNNSGTSVRNRQTADVMGDNNTVNQSNRTAIESERQRRGR